MKIGYFGKLPSYGDFIQRNVCPELVKHWDNWLLQSLSAAQQQLGNKWRDIYFNAPIWRFVLQQNVVSQSTVTGLIMPSVDKAGRCYPLTVICQIDAPINPLVLARKIDKFHEDTEDFVLSLLENNRPDLDEIQQVLSKTYAQLKLSDCQSASNKNLSSSMELACLSEIDKLDFGVANESFLQQLLQQQDISISIWSMGNTDLCDPQIRYFSGLPPTDNYYSFLNTQVI
jgi:type VI secretion system protein ImpM